MSGSLDQGKPIMQLPKFMMRPARIGENLTAIESHVFMRGPWSPHFLTRFESEDRIDRFDQCISDTTTPLVNLEIIQAINDGPVHWPKEARLAAECRDLRYIVVYAMVGNNVSHGNSHHSRATSSDG